MIANERQLCMKTFIQRKKEEKRNNETNNIVSMECDSLSFVKHFICCAANYAFIQIQQWIAQIEQNVIQKNKKKNSRP